MDNLNNIPNSGNWGDAASKLNDNFNKVKQAVTTIENTSKNNKGYFASLSALNTAFPNPKAGQTAYVYSEASSTKYYIYNAFNGGWVTASVEAPSIGVDISEYTKTGGSTKTTKEVEDEIVQLASELQLSSINLTNPSNDEIKNAAIALLSKIWIESPDNIDLSLYDFRINYLSYNIGGLGANRIMIQLAYKLKTDSTYINPTNFIFDLAPWQSNARLSYTANFVNSSLRIKISIITGSNQFTTYPNTMGYLYLLNTAIVNVVTPPDIYNRITTLEEDISGRLNSINLFNPSNTAVQNAALLLFRKFWIESSDGTDFSLYDFRLTFIAYNGVGYEGRLGIQISYKLKTDSTYINPTNCSINFPVWKKGERLTFSGTFINSGIAFKLTIITSNNDVISQEVVEDGSIYTLPEATQNVVTPPDIFALKETKLDRFEDINLANPSNDEIKKAALQLFRKIWIESTDGTDFSLYDFRVNYIQYNTVSGTLLIQMSYKLKTDSTYINPTNFRIGVLPWKKLQQYTLSSKFDNSNLGIKITIATSNNDITTNVDLASGYVYLLPTAYIDSLAAPFYNKINTQTIVATRNDSDFNSIREIIAGLTPDYYNRYIVYVPSGRWFECDLKGKKYVKIVGEDMYNTVIYMDGLSTNTTPSDYSWGAEYSNMPLNEISRSMKHIIFMLNDLELENLTFEANDAKYCLHADANVYENLIVRNCRFVDKGSLNFCVGIGAWGGQNLDFEGCEFVRNNTGKGIFIHNWNNQAKPSYFGVKNSKFTGTGFLYVSELGSEQNDVFELLNCHSDYLSDILMSAEVNSSGTTFWVNPATGLTEPNPQNMPYCIRLNTLGSNVTKISSNIFATSNPTYQVVCRPDALKYMFTNFTGQLT